MIDNIHNDGKDLNDSTIRQFEDYLDVNQNYNNFLPIAEFHDTYEEFPTVYHENVVQEPKKKKEEKKKEQKRESDSSSDDSSGSSDASSSGPTGAESSAGASAGASSSSALADLSASQVLSTTFVTMVAVTAVVVPIIENADLEVNLDVDYNAGILTYMIELINASDGSDYYAVVMEGQTVILQQQIFDNYQSNTITDLRNSQEHRVEVRTGTPPLYVLDSVIIPATPSWAEWGHLTVSYNSIDYGVYFHGDSGEAVLKLTDTNSGEILYTKDLVDGLNSDVIGDLFSSHLYTLTVEAETDVLLIKDIQTEYRDVSWNHLTVVDNVIDYGVEVNLSDVDVTISLYDPSTLSVIYSMDLMQGYNADVIRDLEYNHTYELTVASSDETFLFETLTTDSEPIEVTVGHLTPKDNTIDYELIVSGEGKTVTLNIYDAAGGPSVYTASLTSGSNTGIIEGLEYSHSYLLTVSSASKTYLSESVTTEAEPTKVTLDSLTSTETSVEYKVTVTGNRDTVTAYLKDPTSGETLYTKELTVGTNTAVIEELEAGHTYQFTITSKTETFVDRAITTGSKPTEVTLNYLTPIEDTIQYEVTVLGNLHIATVHLYDAEGAEIYSFELPEGTTPKTIEGLEYGQTYNFVISSEVQIYINEDVTLEDDKKAKLIEFEVIDNSISYTVELKEDIEEVYVVLFDANGEREYTEWLSIEEPLSDQITDLKYGMTYRFVVGVFDFEEEIVTDPFIEKEVTIPSEIDVQKMKGVRNTIEYTVTVGGTTDAVMKIYETATSKYVGQIVLSYGETNYGVIGNADLPLEWNTYYHITISTGSKVWYDEDLISTEGKVNQVQLTADGKIINYSAVIMGSAGETFTLIWSKSGQQEFHNIEIAVTSDPFTISGTIGPDSLEWDTRYSFWWNMAGEELPFGDGVTTGPNPGVDLVKFELNENGVSFEVTVTGAVDAKLILEDETDSKTVKTYTLPGEGESAYDANTDWMVGHRYSLILRPNGEGSDVILGEIEAEPVTSFTVTPDFDSVSYSVGLTSVPSKGLSLYALKQDTSGEWTSVCTPVALTGDKEGSFSNLSEGTYRIALNYSDAGKPGEDPLEYEDVEVGQFDATIEPTVDGDSIKAKVTFQYITKFEGYTIHLYYDENHSTEVPSTNGPNVSGSPETKEYVGLESNHVYYICILHGETILKEEVITTQSFAEIEPTASGHTISAKVTFNVDLRDYSGTTVGVYSDVGCSIKVGDLQSATGSDTYAFTNVPKGTYYVGIKTGTTASVVKAVSDEIVISDEGATLTDLSASVQGMTINYSATFSSDATNGYTIGLYSDQDCSTSIGESVKDITGSSANYNYTVSTYQTCYIGVKTGGGELLGTTTARPNPVISFTTTGNQQIGYEIELSTMSPPNLKVWAIEYSSGALVGSNDLIPGSNEGSITVTDTNYHYRVFINDSQSYEDAYECIETSVYKFEGTTQYIWPAMPGEKVKADIKANWKYGYGTNLKASMYSDEACTTKVEGPYDVPASATGATVSFTNLENDSVTHMDYYYALFDGDISVTVFLVRVPPNPFTGVECIVSGNKITVNIASQTETYDRDYYCYLTESDGETTVYRVKLTDSDKKISSSITFETAEVEYNHDYKVIVSESSYRPTYPYWTTNVSTGSPPSDDEWVVAGSASMVVGHDVVTTGTLKSGLTPTFRYYSNEARTVPIDNLRSLPVDYVVYVKVTTNGNEQYNPFTDSTITFTVLDVASFTVDFDTYMLYAHVMLNMDIDDCECGLYNENGGFLISFDKDTSNPRKFDTEFETTSYKGQPCLIKVTKKNSSDVYWTSESFVIQ